MKTPSAFKRAKRDVEKLVCNCNDTEFAIYFRITRVGSQVFGECPECLAEYGPWSVSAMSVVGDDEALER